jgi:cytochrome c-type biogenesis protein CcmH/NrfF
MNRPPALLLVVAGLAAGGIAAPAASIAVQSPSLPAIERQVMCVSCKIPLNVAESQQADRERVFIRGLIAQGNSETQIKRVLVAQYGPTVLGLPSTHGFDLAAYLVPLAVVVGLLALLARLLPRWRRRAGEGREEPAPPPRLDATEAERLDADLARFN